MDNKATLIAVSGVVAMGLGIIISSVVQGAPVDAGTIQQVVTGLIGFASGAAVTKLSS